MICNVPKYVVKLSSLPLVAALLLASLLIDRLEVAVCENTSLASSAIGRFRHHRGFRFRRVRPHYEEIEACSFRYQAVGEKNRHRVEEIRRIEMLLDSLRQLKVEGASGGGPAVGIVHNHVTKEIVAEGSRIVPLLLKRLDSGGYDESAYIVFCLRELQAKTAKDKILELEKAHDERKRFTEPHDLTLKLQIKFFKQDVDSWK
jgi:hypothetical protein